jgi:hypothetical protein
MRQDEDEDEKEVCNAVCLLHLVKGLGSKEVKGR